MSPFVSIIIPVYNRESTIARAIDSALDQSFKDFELIVVNDGSTDRTEQILSQYKNQIIILNQSNKGVSSARNNGIDISIGNEIAFLDSDDIWHKDKLIEHINYLKRNPHIKVHQTEEIWIRNNVRVNPGKKHKKLSGNIFNESLHLCLISPSAVFIKKEIFDTYGKFDKDLPACEDYDLWLRITPFEEIGLIDKKLMTRYGGHEDQLSAKYWGMDSFRIYSMVKLLEKHGKDFTVERISKITTLAAKKLSLLINGAEKRDNIAYSNKLKIISEKIKSGSYKEIDYQILLEK